MATFTENQDQIKKEFIHLKSIFDKLQPSATLQTANFTIFQWECLAIINSQLNAEVRWFE